MSIRKFKSSILPFFLLSIIVIVLQYLILKSHLKFGFADVDWNFLLSFKELSAEYKSPLSHFIGAWNKWGIYTYQVYYIGLIEKFFGMDYRNFQIVTLIFKIITTISIYPVILLITKSRLAAFLTTLIYSISYSSVGVMYTVVTSGLYVAIPVMSLFFVWYGYLINKGKNSVSEITFAVILFFLTLLLATERMYPLIPTLLVIEFFWCFKNDYSKKILLQAVKRLAFFGVIFLVIFLFKPPDITVVSGNTAITYQKFIEGNWQVILSPIISLGSLFLPKDYWPLLGTPNINGISAYISFLITGPIIIFSFISFALSIFISSKKLYFILKTILPTFISGLPLYILSTHHLTIPETLRMHFDFSYINPALIGSYVIFLNLVFFEEWWKGGKRSNLLISLVGGMVIAFIFIVSTWVSADWTLVFTGIHRYLTIPAIGSSLLVGGLLSIVLNKMRANNFTKPLSFIPFLILLPLIIFNSNVINKQFDYDLDFAGTDASSHIRMKNKLWSYLTNFSDTEPSIFYFDESADHDNGYFDETTIMAGFTSWMRFRGEKIVPKELTPAILRSNLMCAAERSMCLEKVKILVTVQNGEKGILYQGLFYKKENFYAFRFISKDIMDIKPEIVKAIGLN